MPEHTVQVGAWVGISEVLPRRHFRVILALFADGLDPGPQTDPSALMSEARSAPVCQGGGAFSRRNTVPTARCRANADARDMKPEIL